MNQWRSVCTTFLDEWDHGMEASFAAEYHFDNAEMVLARLSLARPGAKLEMHEKDELLPFFSFQSVVCTVHYV